MKAVMEVNGIASDPPNALERIHAASRMCGRVIHVGRGASQLPDKRAVSGLESGTVLDISKAAFEPAQARFRVQAAQVDRPVEELTHIAERPPYDSWQDPPSCYFSTDLTDRRKDVDGGSRAVRISSRVIIRLCALDGPRPCRGSEVDRENPSAWHRDLGTRSERMRALSYTPVTPIAKLQRFCCAAFELGLQSKFSSVTPN
jgi:hypothetical protein